MQSQHSLLKQVPGSKPVAYKVSVRASALKNVTLSYFTISKSYFINYTIPFYNTPYIQQLYYFTFSLKYYFFNLSLLFLSHHHFFLAKEWNNIYIYIYFLAQCYSTILRIVLQHYCKKFCNSEVYHFLMQIFFNYEMPKMP